MSLLTHSKNHKKIILIGIDAGTWDVIKPWAERGVLPTFQKLMKDGVWGVNRSTIPPMTAPSWTSIFTGVNPGKHGVFDFFKLKDNKLVPVTSQDIKIPTIYEILSLYKFRNIIMSLPLSYPPKELFNGIMISDFMYPTPEIYPPDKGKYLIGYHVTEKNYNNKKDRIKKIIDAANSKIETAKKLITNEIWDFFVFYYKESDTIFHVCWKDLKENKSSFCQDNVIKVFKILDDFLNWLLKEVMNDNTILILTSDHGFGDVEYQVNMNLVFRKRGWLTTTTKISDNNNLKIAENKNIHKTTLKMHPVLLRIGRLPIIKPIGKLILKKIFHANILENVSVDYSHSNVYVTTLTSMGIYVSNLELIKEVKNLLKKMKHQHKPIFKDVLLATEIYTGRYMAEAPSLFPISDNYVISPEFGRPSIITEYSEGGWHKPEGIFLAYGYDIRNKGFIGTISVYDIAPTILYIYGLGIPKYMDGKVLGIFKESSPLSKREMSFVEESFYIKEMEKYKLKQKIKNLKKLNKI